MLAHILHSRTCVLRAHTVSTVPGLFILREARKQHTKQPSGSRKSYTGTKMYVNNFEVIWGKSNHDFFGNLSNLKPNFLAVDFGYWRE